VPEPDAARGTTVTVGLVAMPVRVPPEPSRVEVVKVAVPVVLEAVMALVLPYVSVKVDPAVQAIGMVIVQGPLPVIASVPSAQDPVPAVTVVLPVVGAVHPAGTTTVDSEPVVKEPPDGAVNVNMN
jgi:hypothetical protein